MIKLIEEIHIVQKGSMMVKKQCIVVGLLFLLVPALVCAMDANTVVGNFNTGVNPAGLAVTSNGHFAYVANNNNYGIAGSDSVSVLNLQTNVSVMTITDASFNEPYTVTINPSNTRAYVTNSAGSTITIINTANNTVAGTITGFDGPSGMAITADGTRGYVNNYGGPILGSGNGTTVRVVDLVNNTIVGNPIVVGLAPAAIALSPDGMFLYTINYVDGNPGTGTMSIIRTSDNAVVGTITGFSGPFAMAITPDGRYAYVTNFGSNNFAPFGSTVSVVDLNALTIIKTIDVGIQPSGIALSPDGRFAYVTNYNTLYAGSNFTDLTAGQGTVTIIDTCTNKVIAPTVVVGQSPANIAVSPDGNFAYVSEYTSNGVSVIALQPYSLKAKGCRDKHHNKKITNKLKWYVKGVSLPVSYAIYSDAGLTDLMVIIPATDPHTFFDRNVEKGVEYTYYLVGINAAGIHSMPVAVTITKNC